MAASTGSGTKLQYRPYTGGTTASPAYTPIATVKSMTDPDNTIDKIDATYLSGVQKQSTPGLPEYQFMFTVYADESDTAIIAIRSGSKQFPVQWFDWEIIGPSGSTLQFSGYCSSIKPSERNVTDNRTIDITVEVNTIPLYTAPSPGS